MKPLTETDVFEQIVEPRQPGFFIESARAILDLGFNEDAVNRIDELAEKNRQWTLSSVDREDFEKYLRLTPPTKVRFGITCCF